MKRQRAHETAKEARVPTFAGAIDEVIALRRPTWKDADTHAGQFRASLERYVGALGPIQVSRVATADVMQVLTPHWHSVPATADTARRRISAVLQWAIGQGYRSDDPAAKRAVAAALGAQAHRTEHHRAMPYAEVAQAVAAVHAKSKRPLPALALEFMILTTTRSNEARGAAWNEIDLDARTWTIPPGRMKAKRTHRTPLSGRAIAVLDEARTLGPATGDALVFPGTAKGRPHAGRTLLDLLARAGLDTTLHGFRSAFADWARERTNVPTAVAATAGVKWSVIGQFENVARKGYRGPVPSRQAAKKTSESKRYRRRCQEVTSTSTTAVFVHFRNGADCASISLIWTTIAQAKSVGYRPPSRRGSIGT